MKMLPKADFPVSDIRRRLEPGHRARELGLGRQIEHHDDGLAHDDGNLPLWMLHLKVITFEMLRGSQLCVINLPAIGLIYEVVAIGNLQPRRDC